MKENKKQIFILIGVLILCFSGILGLFYEYTFKSLFIYTSGEYLENSIDKSTTIFLSLSAIKAFTAVIEGSQVGISAIGNFSLQVGDIVQSLYDIIDIMWKISFLGVVSLTIQKLFVNYFSSYLLSSLVGVAVLFYIPWLYTENSITLFSKRVSKFIVILFSCVYFLIPINIFLSSRASIYLDEKYRNPAIENLQIETSKLGELSTDISNLQNNENLEEVDTTKWYDITGKISNSISSANREFSNIIENLKTIQKKLEETTSKILKLAIIITTIYFINAILIPFIFLGLIYLFIKIVFLNESNPLKISNHKNPDTPQV